MASLYFFEKYDVMLAIVVVLSTVFDNSLKTVFVLFRCYVLIVLIAWRVLNWHHVGVFLSIDWSFSQFLQCILARRNKIFYTLAELNEWRSSIFRFLKICAIFLGGLKIIRILCLFHILLIRSIVPLTYGRMDRILSSDCVSKTVVLFAYLLIVLIISFFVVSEKRVRFSVRLFLSDWILSIDVLCQRWWKLYVQVNWLQIFCAGWWCDSTLASTNRF